MATYANQTKSTTRSTNYLRRGVVPVMAQLAPYEFIDPAFLDGELIGEVDFAEIVAIAWANSVRDASVFANLARGSSGLTWDQDAATWDENIGNWDNPFFFTNQARSASAFSNLTKH